MFIGNYRGPLTKRGHEFCTDPPLINRSIKVPQSVGENRFQCDNVQGLEQGLYVISELMPEYPCPLDTPEIRHHIFLQVYQDPGKKAEIEKLQALVHQLQEDLLLASDQEEIQEKLNIAMKTLEEVTQAANRARMLEPFPPIDKISGTRNKQSGTRVLIASLDYGMSMEIFPDLNDPHTVFSPILTKSDVEKYDGAIWIDPDFRYLNKSILKIQRTPYTLLDNNCKTAVLVWISSIMRAMPWLTREMRNTAETNMAKPINANVPLNEILGNLVVRNVPTPARFYKRLHSSCDEIPKSPVTLKLTRPQSYEQSMDGKRKKEKMMDSGS